MVPIRMGDRGPVVLKLQQDLNGRSSKLPRLVADGIFGAKTMARVMEFQRDNGLQVDGLVGDETASALSGTGQSFTPADAADLLDEIADTLGAAARGPFLSATRPLLNDPSLFGVSLVEGAAVIIVLFFLLVIAAVLVNSRSKESQQAGRDLAEKAERLRQQLEAAPAKAFVLLATALTLARQAARDLVDRARQARDKCKGNGSFECKKALAALSTAIQSLAEKANKKLGGGITPETLEEGIAFSTAAVIAAAAEAAEKCGCADLKL